MAYHDGGEPVAVVGLKLAPIVGDELPLVSAIHDEPACCPTNVQQVIPAANAGPPANCVPVVQPGTMPSMVNLAAMQVLATTTLAAIVATAIFLGLPANATAVMPERDASLTAVLEELDSHGVPRR
jgi:hypothetical protein